MNFLNSIKRSNNSIEIPNEVKDSETKYSELHNEIKELAKDELKLFEKDAYYLTLNKIANQNGVNESEIWIDYYTGRLSTHTICITRLLRILGQDASVLENILINEKNRAIEDIKRCENIMDLLNTDNIKIKNTEE
ncbi:hypothetical protein [Methanococcus voltae]|uniref:Uncharacterized protein n=1 Tax=Methanococcus voltae (strain ATCC BAA-1334 / A3) TaxID=456320 RepID=D7DQQ8_METV3|nr:hypothetical protein [Methanococcus voltae]MCS3900845.1 hypothetical protein [Methanococcus voltae]